MSASSQYHTAKVPVKQISQGHSIPPCYFGNRNGNEMEMYCCQAASNEKPLLLIPDDSLVVSRKAEDAPSLHPSADAFAGAGKSQQSAWVSYIQRRADAGDKTCKSHAATLSNLLYAANHPSYQKVLELAKSASLNFSVPTEKQPAAVQDIVRLRKPNRSNFKASGCLQSCACMYSLPKRNTG
jgi:hypothetical protein